jgi:beta-barrel assembly-enhancing protease
MRHFLRGPFLAAILMFLPAQLVYSQRTPLKPGGWNLFSTQQEVELGQQVSKDAEQKLPMLNNSRIDDYLNRLGKRLAANAQGAKYPYQFRCVNDASINAFALPGGFLFVNRGTIEAADNEAELAGVIGHEIGHVALRHGTNQATKQYIYQGGAAMLGSLFGKNRTASVITQIGTEFAVGSVLLKYSRDDERQADLFGAQLLYDSNYDPAYLSTFFEKLGTKSGGSDFFNSHPNPENRIRNINLEIGRLGPRSAGSINDSSEFQSIRKYAKSLPPAPKTAGPDQSRNTDVRPGGRPAKPSTRYQSYDAGNMTLRHPDNWQAYGEKNAFTLAPEGGIVQAGNSEALAYGAIMAVYKPDYGLDLKSATDQLIRELQRSNSGMRLSRDQGQIRMGGQTAISKIYSNDSAVGGREVNWLVTALRPEGLVYFIFVSPEEEFGVYQSSFQQILSSVSFR